MNNGAEKQNWTKEQFASIEIKSNLKTTEKANEIRKEMKNKNYEKKLNTQIRLYFWLYLDSCRHFWFDFNAVIFTLYKRLIWIEDTFVSLLIDREKMIWSLVSFNRFTMILLTENKQILHTHACITECQNIRKILCDIFLPVLLIR